MQAVADPGEREKRLHSQAKIIHVREKYRKCFASSVGGTFRGGGGTPHMKVVGMFVVSLRV